MQYDYYAFQKEQLEDCLNELERAVEDFKESKHIKDQEERKRAVQDAENRRKQAAKNVLKIDAKEEQVEPHLPYLWYEAQGSSELKNYIRDAWQKHLTINSIPEAFHFTPDISIVNRMPSLSFMLRVPFKLRKPYLSKDDPTFHLLDNPVRKDKVFQTPMVASTSWKGALRMALIQQLAEWWSSLDETEKNHRSHKKKFVAKRVSIGRLFGTEKGIQTDDQKFESYLDKVGGAFLACWYRRYIRRCISSKGFFSGRLYFYPTFFDKIGLEVINPHERKTGIGKNPILIQCVPVNANGEFVLLYVPFSLVKPDEVAADLQEVAEGVEKMLIVYGFGAKTSSGFGIAELNGIGKLAIRADIPALRQIEPEVKTLEPDLPRYLIAPGRIDPDFLNPDGSFKSEAEYLQGKSGKKAKQLYDKAKKWWNSEGGRLAEAAAELIPEPEPPPSKPPITEVAFDKLSELGDRAREMAEHLCNGDQA